jgi:hypothetical protein
VDRKLPTDSPHGAFLANSGIPTLLSSIGAGRRLAAMLRWRSYARSAAVLGRIGELLLLVCVGTNHFERCVAIWRIIDADVL